LREHHRPHYELGFVCAKAADAAVAVPRRVQRYLHRIALDDEWAYALVAGLTLADFHKSLPHRERLGVWLDVYRPVRDGRRWYLKVSIHEDGERILLLSCCKDSEAH
jgi:hypothetical protein